MVLSSEQKRINEAIGRIRQIEQLDTDSLDTVELILELEDEFGGKIVNLAISKIKVHKIGQSHPLWDRDLDG
jgi:acyl carrier protein